VTAPLEVLVVTVNYRSAELTLRALAALERERGSAELALSVIVVENASGDEEILARAIQERFSSFVRFVASPRNGGYGAGNNLGVRAARQAGQRPRYVHFLNPDTEVRPGAVVELARFLEANPRAGIAGSRFEHADGTPWQVAFRFPTALGELEAGANLGLVTRWLRGSAVAMDLGTDPVRVDWVSGASVMVRTELLEALDGFDEGYFLYFEETDLFLRAQNAGWECWYVPRSSVMHARGQSTGLTLEAVSRRMPAYWFESRRRYFLKHHGLRYTLLADLAAVVGNALGAIRGLFKREKRPARLLRDLVTQSAIWPRNRALGPARHDTRRGRVRLPPPGESHAG
jgi:N-acetylglucosaminyl-diphospho-decaprenol L-rhamnosyltransferase